MDGWRVAKRVLVSRPVRDAVVGVAVLTAAIVAGGAASAAIPPPDDRVGLSRLRAGGSALAESGMLSEREVEQGLELRLRRMRDHRDERRARKQAELDAWPEAGRLPLGGDGFVGPGAMDGPGDQWGDDD